MKTIQLEVHAVADGLPDADTDVLIFDPTSEEGQLGAYMGHDEGTGGPLWVDAHGGLVVGVTHWANMPVLPLKGR